MAQMCEKCGKRPTSGHSVSHSHRRVKRRFLPNLFTTRHFDAQKQNFDVMKVCARCLKTLRKKMV